MIQINVGHWGWSIGENFYSLISQEHSINEKREYIGSNEEEELQSIDVHFNQTEDKYTPRCIFVDLDPRTNDDIIIE